MNIGEGSNVGIVGATGLVGQKMLEILEEREFPVHDLRLFASERSAGQELSFGGESVVVQDTREADFSGLDFALFSAGAEVSKRLAPVAAKVGAIVIDNSSAWRSDPDVPLVVSEVNPPHRSELKKGIIANPNCTTMIAMPVLAPLHREFELQQLVISTQQAVSGAGQSGIDELSNQLVAFDSSNTNKSVFPEPIAFNVIPWRGDKCGDQTSEELKFKQETQKILGIRGLRASVTCTSVPVITGHSISIEARFRKSVTTDEAWETLSYARGVELSGIPTPINAAGGDVSLVGRIRQSGVFGHLGLSLFVTGDNLRKGAALNAVQIAESLQRSY